MVEKEFRVNDDLGDIWTDRITIKVTATQEDSGTCHFNQWTIMTD
tara:strand:+ start:149 stop:283 length:135 start_codon:yes stop_codon:yes gene_type:complete